MPLQGYSVRRTRVRCIRVDFTAGSGWDVRMYNYLRFCWVGLVLFSAACGSNNSAGGDDTYAGPTGGAKVYTPTGGANNVGAGGSATSNVGGAGVSGGGAGQTTGTANMSGSTSTSTATGGRDSTHPVNLNTGGTTVVGTSICAGSNVCGQMLDANGNPFDCGFQNCPQGICGLDVPNQCPVTCSSKVTCAANECGQKSDGCGGIVDCGYTACPQSVCGQKAANQCPGACTTKVTCSATQCGVIPDGCGGTVDCGYTACPQSVCGQQTPNQCPPACNPGNKIDCTSAGNKDCGVISDGCGGLIDCGSNNCPANLCGLVVPNQCPSTCITKIDCTSAGNKDCGLISDGCGGTIDCGTCSGKQCCGCGGSGSPGVANKCGGGTTTDGSGLSQTCLAGQKGCLCDSLGGCAPGLTCNTSATPQVCCSGADCTLPANTMVGSSCTGTTAASACTPGITIPTASGSNDNCGYPSTSFNESQFICGIVATGGGAKPGQVQAFFNDEMSTTLGCTQNGYTVTPMSGIPAYALYPSTGDPTCMDTNGRPLRPALYITDITNDPNCTAGDQQKGGQPYDPVGIFGSWTTG